MSRLVRLAHQRMRQPHDFERTDVLAVLEAERAEQALFETVLAVTYFHFLNRTTIELGQVADFWGRGPGSGFFALGFEVF